MREAEETKSRIKVLALSPTLAHGGAERFVSNLFCQLDQSRFAPYLCVLRDEIQYPLPEHVEVVNLKKYRPWHIPRAILGLQRELDRVRPDVVLGNMTFTACLLSAALSGTHHRPLMIARFASNPKREYRNIYHFLYKRFAVHFLMEMDIWVANSAMLADHVATYYGKERKHVYTIYNPVDFKDLDETPINHRMAGTDSDATVILAVGRLTQQKRFDHLLKAFARISSLTNTQLWVAGDGPLRTKLAKLANHLNITGRVHWLGYRHDIANVIQNADIFALTSDYEGMPNALIEAQALGLPAVATDCETGPNEIIVDGDTGFLVSCGDVDTIADRLLQLLQDRNLRQTMGRRAAERVRIMFDSGRTIAQWEHLLNAATNHGIAEPYVLSTR